ncbi:trans-Golgi network integral membrane protein 2-like [Anopheles nili]|uniref:trans-Golgi network integral membrane protein 2-like n=1 Tax=Anopheles nili TaxID=185578 RepID=UPI00237B49DB|nr:trans-Golgi network integral membrane protein 2-like [Anopheles nili]
MQNEAIILTLFGLVVSVLTAPPVEKYPVTQPPKALDTMIKGNVNSSRSAKDTHLRQVKEFCSTMPTDTSCLAYEEMVGVMNQLKLIGAEQTIERELETSLSTTDADYFCSKSDATAVPKDICRALLIGYTVISQSYAKEEPNKQHPSRGETSVHKSGSMLNQTSVAKIVPAAAAMRVPALNIMKADVPALLNNDTIKNVLNPTPVAVASDNARIQHSGPGVQVEQPQQVPAAAGDRSPPLEAKPQEKVEKQPAPPVAPQQETENEDKDPSEDDMEQQQGELDVGEVAQFEDDTKQQMGDPGAKDGIAGSLDNSEESEDKYHDEDGTDNGELKGNGFESVGKGEAVEKPKPQETVESDAKIDDQRPVDNFYDQKGSNFFSYFLFAMFTCPIVYVAYHNKSKLLALVVEGRRTSSGRGGFSKGRKHTAAYRKLDTNLEEAITSGNATGGHSSSQIIY